MKPWGMRQPELDEFKDQPGVSHLVRELSAWKKGKAILIGGNHGTGKTTSIYAYAKKHEFDVVELNAGDVRNSKNLGNWLSNAGGQQSLLSKHKIILVDEIEGLSGRADRGALPTLLKAIESSAYPIIIIGHDLEDRKYNNLKKKSSLINYEDYDHNAIYEILKKTCLDHEISYEDKALKILSRMSGGDVRAALNDLQALDEVNTSALDGLSSRDMTEKIVDALVKVFKTKNPEIARSAYQNIDEDIDTLFSWIDENLPREYKKPEDLANAMRVLAEADKYKGRIRRWQYYRYYVYIYDLLSVGIALAKQEKYEGMIKYRPSTKGLKIWIMNQKNAKKKGIAELIAEKTHTSSRRVMQDFYYYKQMLKHDPEIQEGLDKEYLDWVKK